MTAARSGGRVRAYVLRTAAWIPFGIVGLFVVPLAFTNRSFGPDWTLHLWAIRQQQFNIQATGHPGLFLSATPLGAFYPIFAFVGSGVYGLGGYLAILLDNRPLLAYKLIYVAGFACAYGGLTWLSVQFGLRGWRSQVPGAVFVTGAYFLTDMADRGDFAEFMALAAIPLLLAAACAMLRAPRRTQWQRLAVVAAVFLLTGSHNITLLWGSVFIVFVGLVACVGWGPTWNRPLPWRRIGELLGLGAIGVGLNAWYLFPDLAYGFDTAVAAVNRRLVPSTYHVHIRLLLDPLRPADRVTGHFSVFSDILRLSFPVLFFGWALVVAIASWRAGERASRRMFVALVCVTAGFAELVVNSTLWKRLPTIFYNVQFTYRLDAYVLLATALVVLVALLWQARDQTSAQRVTSVVLVAILGFTVATATWQVWHAPSKYVARTGLVTGERGIVDQVVHSRYVAPPSWYGQGDFRDVSSPVVAVDASRLLRVPYGKIHGSSFAGVLAVPDGRAPFLTNLAGGPRFVTMTGIRAVGRSGVGNFIVATRTPEVPATGPVRVTIEQRGSALLRAGSAVSLLSVLALAGLIAWPARRLFPGAKPHAAGSAAPPVKAAARPRVTD